MVRSSQIGQKWRALVVLGLLAWCRDGLADEPPSQPVLRLETGMHTAAIQSISADARRQMLLTVSYDKTARLWSLADGKLIRVLRPPIGLQYDGRLYAGALSPSGEIAAVGGSTGYEWSGFNSVYLFETNSGKLLRRLTLLPDDITSLAFSSDGTLLAVGLADRAGVRVWRTSDWIIAWSDSDYTDFVSGLAFSKSNELITASFDGYLRGYDARGHLRQPKMKAFSGARPLGLAMSPDGERLAVGYDDSARVDLLAASDLRLLAGPDTTGLHGAVGRLAWSEDGRTLFAGYQARNAEGRTLVRSWMDSGHGGIRDAPVAGNAIMGLAPLPSQGVAFASFEPTWGVLHDDAHLDPLHVAPTADYSRLGEGFRISSDAREVQFRFGPSARPVTFVLADRRIVDSPIEVVRSIGPATSGSAMAIQHWEGETTPVLNGTPLRLLNHEESRAVAIRGERLLVGATFSLRLYDKSGSQIWRRYAPGFTRAVNISQNGALAVAAFADGTIRWYRMRDGVELLTLFPHADRRRWVAWTPQGYYDASTGGDELIGWHVNRGASHEADFFPARQFSEQFNRPDIVALVLDTLDLDEAVRQANTVAKRKAPAPVASLLPPVVKILSPPDLSSVARSPIDVTYLVRSPTPVTAIAVLVDGRPVQTPPSIAVMSGADGAVESVSVPMPEHNATISLVAANAQTKSEAAVVNIGWQGEKDWYKPDLYVLAVGVAHYRDPGLKLSYPAKDAADFAAMAKAQAGGLYNHVEVRELPDEHATREEIRKGLSWLKKTPARDVAVLFLSGHGQNDAGGHYHFLPYDTDQSDLDLTTIQDFEIEDFLGKVPGKVIAFLDTCFAGGAGGKKERGPTQPDVDGLANKLVGREGHRGVHLLDRPAVLAGARRVEERSVHQGTGGSAPGWRRLPARQADYDRRAGGVSVAPRAGIDQRRTEPDVDQAEDHS
jgi:WD40 repeat protein